MVRHFISHGWNMLCCWLLWVGAISNGIYSFRLVSEWLALQWRQRTSLSTISEWIFQWWTINWWHIRAGRRWVRWASCIPTVLFVQTQNLLELPKYVTLLYLSYNMKYFLLWHQVLLPVITLTVSVDWCIPEGDNLISTPITGVKWPMTDGYSSVRLKRLMELHKMAKRWCDDASSIVALQEKAVRTKNWTL